MKETFFCAGTVSKVLKLFIIFFKSSPLFWLQYTRCNCSWVGTFQEIQELFCQLINWTHHFDHRTKRYVELAVLHPKEVLFLQETMMQLRFVFKPEFEAEQAFLSVMVCLLRPCGFLDSVSPVFIFFTAGLPRCWILCPAVRLVDWLNDFCERREKRRGAAQLHI